MLFEDARFRWKEKDTKAQREDSVNMAVPLVGPASKVCGFLGKTSNGWLEFLMQEA